MAAILVTSSDQRPFYYNTYGINRLFRPNSQLQHHNIHTAMNRSLPELSNGAGMKAKGQTLAKWQPFLCPH